MSAIFGVVHWDGEPVAPDALARMDSVLSPYGTDRGGIWREGAVGLGHRLSEVTPEDRHERQPLHCSGGNGVVVTDARIDNRDELARAWSIGACETRDWPDSAFVARALDGWGEQGPGRLQGAFALVHWDRREERLLLARSPFCERQLFYHSTPRTFAFASMPKGLFASDRLQRALDEPFLADFLAVERLDPGGSFYRDVHRLHPGHVLVVSRTGTRSWPFWRPDTIRELRLSSDEAYVEAFLEVYSRAVGDALRSAGRVGIMLSGGLDSSSVAALAAPLLAARGERLTAFTEVPPKGFAGAIVPGRYADETPFVESLAQRHDNIDLTLVRADEQSFLDNVDARFDVTELPVRGALNMVWWDALMDQARRQGVRVLLNGIFGNFTVSYKGDGVLCQMVGQGRVLDALRQARALSRTNGGASMIRTFLSLGVLPWLPTSIYLGIQAFRDRPRYPWRESSPVLPEFETLARVKERAKARGPDSRLRLQPDTRATRYLLLPRAGGGFDGHFAGCHAAFGVAMCDPTADTRLVEFCLSLPEDQYLRDGQTRWLIRRAMTGRVPRAILNRRTRGLQIADWHSRMLRDRNRMLSELARFERCDLARRALDLRRLRELVEGLPSADAADNSTFQAYRGVLELGLEAGRFILWAHMGGPERRES